MELLFYFAAIKFITKDHNYPGIFAMFDKFCIILIDAIPSKTLLKQNEQKSVE
jgi:hypothetical protein